MKAMRTIWVLMFLIAGANSLSAAEPLTAEKRADLERLLDLTNSLAVSQQISSAAAVQLAQVLKAANPYIPQALIDKLPSIVNSVIADNVSTLKELIITLYDKYFSGNELKEIIRFYSTALGQKMIKVMPSLVEESMVAGQHWGQSLGPEIERRVREQFKQAGVEL